MEELHDHSCVTLESEGYDRFVPEMEDDCKAKRYFSRIGYKYDNMISSGLD